MKKELEKKVKVKYQEIREVLKELYKSAYNTKGNDKDNMDFSGAYEKIEKILESKSMKFPCRKSEVQCYDCQVCCAPKWKSAHKQIAFDKCLANELFYLWDKGIITSGCCCGNHTGEERGHSYIGVENEFIPVMKKLGYKVRINLGDKTREDSFIPKSI